MFHEDLAVYGRAARTDAARSTTNGEDKGKGQGNDGRGEVQGRGKGEDQGQRVTQEAKRDPQNDVKKLGHVEGSMQVVPGGLCTTESKQDGKLLRALRYG